MLSFLEIDFYLSLGAEPMKDWTVYRLNDQEIENMINNN